MTHGQRVALWREINNYMVACGGSESSVTVERQLAVVGVERAVEAIEAEWANGLRRVVAGDEECEEFEPSALEVAANPDVGRDCDGNGWYRCRECARWTGEDE